MTDEKTTRWPEPTACCPYADCDTCNPTQWHLDDDRAPLPPKPPALSEPKPPPLPAEIIRAYRDRIRKETP